MNDLTSGCTRGSGPKPLGMWVNVGVQERSISCSELSRCYWRITVSKEVLGLSVMAWGDSCCTSSILEYIYGCLCSVNTPVFYSRPRRWRRGWGMNGIQFKAWFHHFPDDEYESRGPYVSITHCETTHLRSSVPTSIVECMPVSHIIRTHDLVPRGHYSVPPVQNTITTYPPVEVYVS